MNIIDSEREFIGLITGLRDMLYRLARSIVLDDQEAEDVVSDIFERAWKMRDTVLTSSNPRAYICRMARNMAIDSLRRRKRHNELSVTFDLGAVDVSKRLDACDMVEISKQLIDCLPERQRTVVQLRDVEGYEIGEIAQILECEESSVRMNLSRARRYIREQLLIYMNYGVERS